MTNNNPNTQIDPTLLTALGQMGSFLQIVEETARGFRTHMIREGWTEETAEEIAATFLNEMILKLLSATNYNED